MRCQEFVDCLECKNKNVIIIIINLWEELYVLKVFCQEYVGFEFVYLSMMIAEFEYDT